MRWYEQLDEKLRDYLPDLTVQAEEPLAKHTSFRIGGPARRMAFPQNAEQLVLLLNFADQCGARPFLLGNGTNVLFPDGEVDRLIVNTRDMAGVCLSDAGRVRADAGATLARVANFACQQGLAGLEFAHGIPGSVGGGVCMNAGAYGGEMAQVIDSVTVLFPDEGIKTLSCADMAFGYRHSLLMEYPGAVVLHAEFALEKDDSAAIRSRMDDLIFQEFKGTGNMELVLNRRIAEQYIFPAVDILKSGTRREELIMPEAWLYKMNLIRRALAGHKPVEAMERFLFFLNKYPSNTQMLLDLKQKA